MSAVPLSYGVIPVMQALFLDPEAPTAPGSPPLVVWTSTSNTLLLGSLWVQKVPANLSAGSLSVAETLNVWGLSPPHYRPM